MDVSLDYTIDTDKIFKVGVCRLDFRTAEYPEQYVLANIYKNFNDYSIEYKLSLIIDSLLNLKRTRQLIG